MKTIGFIGLGNMGMPMALNLVKTGYPVQVYDLVEDNMSKLVSEGARACGSALEAAEGAEVLISMLPAGKHVSSLYTGEDGLAKQISTDTLIIDCSTIEAETARSVHEHCESLGITMIDAPVSGGVAAASAGTLTFMCGGSDSGFKKAAPILEAMGANIFHAGPSGSGQAAKMCNNMLLAIHMIGTCEAIKLGEKNGLDPKVLSEIMLASSGDNWSLQKYNPCPGVMPNAPASKDYQPGFMVDLMTKDLGLAINNAASVTANVELGQHCLTLFKAKQDKGDGQKDFSSIFESI